MKNLKLTTFNIRCFGFNGDYFAPSPSESRISYIKSFLEENYNDTDVFILQEVMDYSLLKDILPVGFKAYYVPHSYPRHMHVALCCRDTFEFLNVEIIPNTALDDTKSRPALYGKLVKNNTFIAHIIGVHLKSGYEHSDNRLKQAHAIVDYLNDIKASDLKIIAGDFNSHTKDKTGKDQDDLFFLNEIFQKLDLKNVDQNNSTYVTAFEKAKLDHFWTNSAAKEISIYDYNLFSHAEPLKEYFDKISDHLPVTINLALY